jgi:histone-lysine N-methyltransferase SETMAR
LETLKQLKWEAMEHPAYNPDLAPSDFHLFGPLKEALRGRRFAISAKLKTHNHMYK